MGEFACTCYAEVLCTARQISFYERTGEGGIRTLGSLLGYGALAKRCFRPLSHLTNIFYNNVLQLFLISCNRGL
jgi:hypothetical protein